MQLIELNKDSWKLEDEKLSSLRAKVSNHQNLKTSYGSPSYGIKTGLNDAFIITRKLRDSIISDCPKASELIMPFVEGKDLKKWHHQGRDLWLIAIPKYWTREKMAIEGELTEEEAWQWLQKSYPAITEWLTPFADKARKRGDKGEFWWELRSCAYYDSFLKPKIFYPDLSQGSKFHLDITGAVSVNTVYFYPLGDFHLLGLLNSKVIWFYLQGVCEALRGGIWRLRLFTQYMDTIPIPSTNGLENLAEEIQEKSFLMYRCESMFSRRLADLCPDCNDFKLSKKLKNWWELDFSSLQSEIKKSFKGSIPLAERNDWQDYFESEQTKRQQLQAKVTLLEDELNQEVYKLFNLTPDEIGLIEAEVK